MKRKFNTSLSFIDMLFNILLGFFMLLMIALMIVNPKKKKEETSPIEIDSDILVTIEWPGKYKSDVDLFVELPNKKIVWFHNTRMAGSHLDRDDRGVANDLLRMPDGSTQLIRENWEHVFITKVMPGWYTVNILLYEKLDRGKIPVKVKIEAFKPYRLIYMARPFLVKHREELTQIRFKLDGKGRIVQKSDKFKSLTRLVGDMYND